MSTMQNKLYLILLGVLLLIGVCASQETDKGIVSVDSTLTWYLCAAQNTSYIYYDVAKVTSGTPDNNFGTINAGANFTISSITEGFVTLLTSRAGVRDFLNPAVKNIPYNASLSCSSTTVTKCEKSSDVASASWCLIVYNPTTEKLLLNVVFSTNKTTTTSSPTTTTAPSPTSSPEQNSAGQNSRSGVETRITSVIFGLLAVVFLTIWV
jgi:hypothetical protein